MRFKFHVTQGTQIATSYFELTRHVEIPVKMKYKTQRMNS